MTILLVEDAEDSRHFISAILKAAGHAAIEAEDGESAIKAFENSDCSVVLLDWMLPDISGIEVANRIKQIRYSYVIMLTAMTQREHGEEALNAGARDYLEKPFEPEDLIEAVELGVAVVDARKKFEARMMKRGVNIETLKELA